MMNDPESLPAPLIPINSPYATLESVGGKAMNLARITIAGFPVPDGFFIPTSCYRDFIEDHDLKPKIDAALRNMDPASPEDLNAASTEIRSHFVRYDISKELITGIETGWHLLGSVPVAVRSSATAEDLPGMSFAGQQDTYLNIVNPPALLEAVVKCWSSLWTARAIGYRTRNKLSNDDLSIGVVVQAMVMSESSGVMFTANPLTGSREETVIDATWGLGEALVGGYVEPDHYVVASDKSIKSISLGGKSLIITPSEVGGVVAQDTAPSHRQAIPDSAILELAELGDQITGLFDFPQDIEWGYISTQPGDDTAGGDIYILQSRPITTLFPVPVGMDPEPLKTMFGFHIVQGITEPLTPIGQDTMKLVLTGGGQIFKLGYTIETQTAFYVAAERLWINIAAVFKSPIGHKVIPRIFKSLDPGSGGAIQVLLKDPRLTPGHQRPSLRSIRRFAGFMLPFLARVIRTLKNPAIRRDEVIQAFEGRISETMAAETSSGEMWINYSRRIKLLNDAKDLFPEFVIPIGVPPIVAGMVSFFGILERFSREVGDVTGDPQFNTLHLEIARGLPHNVTTEMDLNLWATAQTLQADPDSAEAFEKTSAADLSEAYMQEGLPTKAQYAVARFLGKYGARGLGEIDIGRPRWREDPTHIMQVLQSYLNISDPFMAPDVVFERGSQAAGEAAEKLIAAVQNLPGGWLKTRLVRFAVDRYRMLAGMREAPKFFAIRMMGIIRQGLLQSGQDFVDAGLLKDPDDLFFLYIRELNEISVQKRFPEDIADRITERQKNREREMLRRQIPRMLLSDGTAFYGGVQSPDKNSTDIVGDPVSPGLVEGIVRVIFDPLKVQLEPGEILVCPGTDPAWTPLFLAAAGLVMEVGGMMTHGSVVAREYGIPAVVGVHQATSRLETGQRVRLDGNTGIIEICE
jgi:pyruvate,water dikinase